MATKIYILQLEEGKYYVGKSNNIDKRISEHFSGKGSKWTQLYKPMKVLTIIDDSDLLAEEKHTYLTMDKYGIDNVRGGSYTTVKLSEHDKKKISEFIHTMKNECYICGNRDHFVNECPSNKSIPITRIIIPHFRSNIIVGDKKKDAHVDIEKYNNFIKHCNKDCENCNNTRICYQYRDEDNDCIYVSCVFCYDGTDWGNDMFVAITKSK
jgi:hypothetical protein